jgi:hypothetical protein
MRKAFIYSIVFHLGVAVLALVGIPLGEPLIDGDHQEPETAA